MYVGTMGHTEMIKNLSQLLDKAQIFTYFAWLFTVHIFTCLLSWSQKEVSFFFYLLKFHVWSTLNFHLGNIYSKQKIIFENISLNIKKKKKVCWPSPHSFVLEERSVKTKTGAHTCWNITTIKNFMFLSYDSPYTHSPFLNWENQINENLKYFLTQLSHFFIPKTLADICLPPGSSPFLVYQSL